MNCTSKLIKTLFDQKFSCARTKTEAIVKNVLLPYYLTELKTTLDNIRFTTLYFDASNHKNIKLFPYLIRYFDVKQDIQVTVLHLVSLPGENSKLITDSILNILNSNNVSKKLVGYCADNANTNFSGLERKGQNNIYHRLIFTLNRPTIGVGCAAHIIHNAAQTAADMLPTDIETIAVKIYIYFF